MGDCVMSRIEAVSELLAMSRGGAIASPGGSVAACNAVACQASVQQFKELRFAQVAA